MHRARVQIAVAAVACAVLQLVGALAPTGQGLAVDPAQIAPPPPRVIAIGRLFDDTVDTRPAAQHVTRMGAALAYATETYLTGRPSMNAWYDGQRASVLAIFAHSNAGFMLTYEGATDAQDEWLGAGTLTTVSTAVSPSGPTDGTVPYNFHFGPAGWAFWKDYQTFGDVDDLLVAILAGCFTANTSPTRGNFLEVGRQRGMDAVVGWTGLNFFPSGGCTDCNYSGNYFWDRWSTYAQAGDTISTALSKAVADLIALEGSAGGWDGWLIRGAATAPGDVRLIPAREGTPLDSKPFGIDPFNPLQLSVAASRDVTVSGVRYTDVDTREGVSYRIETDTGRLTFITAPAALEGDPRFTMSMAEAVAREFARSHVSWVRIDEMTLRESIAIAHVYGEQRYRFRWRPLSAELEGPRHLVVEVDARTGSVVFLAAAEQPEHGSRSVSASDAAALAHRVAPGATVTTVTGDVWGVSRWTVELARERADGLPDVTKVVIDAATGAVLSIAKT
jgi:hypothetical protein